MISVYLAIGLGAAVGGAARYGVSGLLVTIAGDTFPWGTLAVNVLGSAFLGFFATLTGADGRLLIPTSTRLMVTVGFCGGFTTFSTFSLETLSMAMDRQYLKAGCYVSASLATCLIGVWCGYLLASGWNQH